MLSPVVGGLSPEAGSGSGCRALAFTCPLHVTLSKHHCLAGLSVLYVCGLSDIEVQSLWCFTTLLPPSCSPRYSLGQVQPK
jgi:hypothetical protein